MPVASTTAAKSSAAPARQVAGWLRRLDRCAQKSSPVRVHNLRSATLRLEASLEFRLRGCPPDGIPARAVRRWAKHARRLRRALGELRGLDVTIEKLTHLQKTLLARAGENLSLRRSCRQDLRALQHRLKKQRRRAIRALAQSLKKQLTQMHRTGKQLEVAFASVPAHAGLSTAADALQQFAAATREHSPLSGRNLHEYRKQIKKARYLTEISAVASPRAQRLAAELKLLQDAIGDWHDWEAMSLEAERNFPHHGAQSELAAALREMTAQSLKQALALCARTAALLLRRKNANAEDGA